MPTILINTNLLKSSASLNDASNSITTTTADNELKQDINSIITKLITKSESVSFFFFFILKFEHVLMLLTLVIALMFIISRTNLFCNKT